MTLVLNGTTGVSSVDGSASTPAVQGGDSNTGVFFPAADTVAIATGGTEAVRVDSSGNFGVGTSSPSAKLNIYQSGSASAMALIYNNTNAAELKIQTNANDAAFTSYYTNGNRNWSIGPGQTTANLFEIRDLTAGATRVGIDSSGNLLVGTTSQIASGKVVLSYSGINNNGIVFDDTAASSTTNATVFRRNGVQVGSINTTTTATTYSTSSDYRLKHDITPMTGALARVTALKPVTYKWNVDDSDGEGFIAHELQEVCPDAVTGEKDAVDADGNIVPQGIDTSFLVATLTAAIQEQQALIESLTARIAALEAA